MTVNAESFYSVTRTPDICGICPDSLQTGDPVAHTGLGGHLHPMHRKCIKEWAIRQRQCPYCRVPIEISSLQTWKDKVQAVIIKMMPMAKQAAVVGIIGVTADIALRIIFGSTVNPINEQIISIARQIILIGALLVGEEVGGGEVGVARTMIGPLVGNVVANIALAELMTGEMGTSLARELGAMAIGAGAAAAVGAGQRIAEALILQAQAVVRIAGGAVGGAATAGLGLTLTLRRAVVLEYP
jgi:hypothetical protein